MPTNCVAFGCRNWHRPGEGKSFFRFPSAKYDPDRRAAWTRAVKRARWTDPKRPWEPSEQSRLCGAHFVTGKSFNRSSEVQIEDDRKLRDRYIAASLNRKTIAGQAPPRLRADRVRARQKTAAASRSLHAMEKSRVHRRYEVTLVETYASFCTLAISWPFRVRALKLAVLPDGGSLMCNDLRTDGVGSAKGGCISVKNVFCCPFIPFYTESRKRFCFS